MRIFTNFLPLFHFQGARILVCDEATASIDVHTEQKLQAVLRNSFSHATVLTIAHRIDTILNSDRVFVLSNGVLVEDAPPQELLLTPTSLFRALAADAGISIPTPLPSPNASSSSSVL